MFEFFWDTVETIDKSKTDGFELLGRDHLIWLAILLAVGIVFSLAYKRLDKRGRYKFRTVFVAILFAFEIVRYVSIYMIGVPLVNYAPVQLCHISLYLVMLHCILANCGAGYHKPEDYRKRDKCYHYIGNFLYLVGLPAGLSALLFPAWKSLPAFCNCSSLYSFLSHGLFVIYIIAALITREIKRDSITIPFNICILFIMAAGVYAFDLRTDHNFMYLVHLSPGSPLTPFETFGDYRIGYVVILIGLILLLYGVPALVNRIRNKQ